MDIKQPPVYDISHWKEVPDFSLIEPKPFLMLTKATEETWLKDWKCVRFMEGMKRIGCHRGVYHFFRKSAKGTTQARYFCDFIRTIVDDKTILALDMEEGGENATEIINFFLEVSRQFPNNKLLWYTSQETLKTFIFTPAQQTILKSIPTWMAGYPLDPDPFNKIPVGYLDPRFGKTVLWQYSEKGQVQGIIGNVDLNLITPEYQQELGEVTPTTPTGENMYKGTVLTGFTLVVRDPQGTDTGIRLTANDVVYGEVSNNRISFDKIYKASGNILNVQGNAATADPTNLLRAYMTLDPITPTEVTKTHQIDIFSNGSIAIDGNPYP